MILVSKHTKVPQRLVLGDVETTTNCAAVSADFKSFEKGIERFKFKNTIYGHPSVKKQLKKDQHDKCCYCEVRFEVSSFGDVEHFRPKGEVIQHEGDQKERPGYYWLAYSWLNLYFSCEICNRRNKKSFFPLKDSTKRAKIHTANINDEQPLLLDPRGPDDPRNHIKFHNEVAVGVTPEGKQTVKTLKLDRLALNEERLKTAILIKLMRDIVKEFETNPSPQKASILDDARIYLANAVKPDAIFSAMAQDILR